MCSALIFLSLLSLQKSYIYEFYERQCGAQSSPLAPDIADTCSISPSSTIHMATVVIATFYLMESIQSKKPKKSSKRALTPSETWSSLSASLCFEFGRSSVELIDLDGHRVQFDPKQLQERYFVTDRRRVYSYQRAEICFFDRTSLLTPSLLPTSSLATTTCSTRVIGAVTSRRSFWDFLNIFVLHYSSVTEPVSAWNLLQYFHSP